MPWRPLKPAGVAKIVRSFPSNAWASGRVTVRTLVWHMASLLLLLPYLSALLRARRLPPVSGRWEILLLV